MTICKYKCKLFLGLIIPTFLFIINYSTAEAGTVVRSGEVINISEEEVVQSNFYGAATSINLSGIMEEDVIVLAGHVNVDGQLNKSTFIFSGSSEINSQVGDDIRILGGKAVISGNVAGDVLFVGGDLTILPSASIEGDLLIYAGGATIQGKVGGNIIGSISDLIIDSEVVGNVSVKVTSLILNDNTNIGGSVNYTSSDPIVKSLNSKIVGEVVRSDGLLPDEKDYKWPWVGSSLMFLFTTLTWYLLTRSSMNILMNHAISLSIRPFAYGIAFIVIIPVVVVILFLSTIGAFSAIIITLLYLSLLSVSVALSIIFMGQTLLILTTKRDKTNVTLITVLTGVIVFGILSMLGVIGYIIMAVATVISIGAFADILINFFVSKRHLLF
jgi:cytoskeletal protein CcmA (bactofilin family)